MTERIDHPLLRQIARGEHVTTAEIEALIARLRAAEENGKYEQTVREAAEERVEELGAQLTAAETRADEAEAALDEIESSALGFEQGGDELFALNRIAEIAGSIVRDNRPEGETDGE